MQISVQLQEQKEEKEEEEEEEEEEEWPTRPGMAGNTLCIPGSSSRLCERSTTLHDEQKHQLTTVHPPLHYTVGDCWVTRSGKWPSTSALGSR